MDHSILIDDIKEDLFSELTRAARRRRRRRMRAFWMGFPAEREQLLAKRKLAHWSDLCEEAIWSL